MRVPQGIDRAALLLAALCAPRVALAQPRPLSAEAEAREHFRRGVARTDEGAYDAAMSEFNAAWELTRDPRILYNVALTHEARGDAASALTTLDRFEREAPPRAVTAARRELDEARTRLSTRVATVAITVDVPGVEVRVDGVRVDAASARAGALVNAGRRRITLSAPGWQPYERTVDLAAGAREVIRDGMAPTLSAVTVECDVADAEVLIDGARVGVTPAEVTAAVREGAHTVEVRRTGYTTFSRVVEARGVGARVRAELAWATVDASTGARLVVRATEPEVTVTLDGHAVAADGREMVPPGRHRLRVTAVHFQPAEREVLLAAGATREERVALAPTPAFRAEYEADAARARQRASWVFWPGVIASGLGASAVIAGAPSRSTQTLAPSTPTPGDSAARSEAPATPSAPEARATRPTPTPRTPAPSRSRGACSRGSAWALWSSA